MRLLFVSDFLPKWDSGAEGSLLCIGEAMEKRGHGVTYLWKDMSPKLLPHARLRDLFELPKHQLRAVGAALRRSTYDVVIQSQPYCYLVNERLAALYPGTLFLNRTHGWEDRMADSWRLLGWKKAGWFRRTLSDLCKTHVGIACDRTVRSSHGILAGSELCGSYIRTHYQPHHTPVAVIPYGVDTDLFGGRDNDGSQRMLFVGQYLPRKGCAVLEAALPHIARLYANGSMTFVVPQGQVEQVEKFYRPWFGERLTVLPWMSREKLARVYAQHDILLFPSYFEGFGKVFLEGMAAGLCVVGFREGGLCGIAKHMRDALVCEPGDVAAFRMLTEQALCKPELVRDLGERAQTEAQSFTWERHAIETERFCHRLKFGAVRAAMAS